MLGSSPVFWNTLTHLHLNKIKRNDDSVRKNFTIWVIYISVTLWDVGYIGPCSDISRKLSLISVRNFSDEWSGTQHVDILNKYPCLYSWSLLQPGFVLWEESSICNFFLIHIWACIKCLQAFVSYLHPQTMLWIVHRKLLDHDHVYSENLRICFCKNIVSFVWRSYILQWPKFWLLCCDFLHIYFFTHLKCSIF